MLFQQFPSFLFTEEQFNQASNYKRLQLQCQCCGKQFTRFKHQIEKHLQRLDGSITCDNQSNINSAKSNALNHLLYCSDVCINKKSKWNDIKTFTCPQCGKVFERPAGRVKQTKTGLQFCSQKCSRQYYSDHEIAREWSTMNHTNPNRNFLFDEKQLKEAMGPSKSNEKLLPVRCIQCGKTFYVSYSYVKNFYNGKGYGKDRLFQMRFCSNECFIDWQRFIPNDPLRCASCGEIIDKTLNIEFGGRHFCSQYCLERYKKYLERTENSVPKLRSSVEYYCEQFIKLMWPQLEVQFNTRDQLDCNLELDIWFPTLRFAVEINGIYHYRAVKHRDSVLNDRVEKIAQKDQLKRQICQNKNIDLLQIDTHDLIVWPDKMNKTVVKPIVENVYKHLGQPIDWNMVNQKLLQLRNQFDFARYTKRKIPPNITPIG